MSQLPQADKRWIPDAKVRDYCLSGATEKSRSRLKFFEGYGFKQTEWTLLRDALLEHPLNGNVALARQDAYGVTYEVVGSIPTPNGQAANIRSFWIIRADDPRPQFTSALPA